MSHEIPPNFPAESDWDEQSEKKKEYFHAEREMEQQLRSRGFWDEAVTGVKDVIASGDADDEKSPEYIYYLPDIIGFVEIGVFYRPTDQLEYAVNAYVPLEDNPLLLEDPTEQWYKTGGHDGSISRISLAYEMFMSDFWRHMWETPIATPEIMYKCQCTGVTREPFMTRSEDDFTPFATFTSYPE